MGSMGTHALNQSLYKSLPFHVARLQPVLKVVGRQAS
jgi:hypothetical protein